MKFFRLLTARKVEKFFQRWDSLNAVDVSELFELCHRIGPNLTSESLRRLNGFASLLASYADTILEERGDQENPRNVKPVIGGTS